MTETQVPTQPTNFDEVEAILAEKLDGYEKRPHQQALAHEVEDFFADNVHRMAEAGCGVGKSFACSIPAITSGKRVVVSTATKALQDQLKDKDMPFLKENCEVDFSYAILKGRANYVCLAALNENSTDSVAPVVFRALDDPNYDGDRANLDFEMPDLDWQKFSTTSDECPGKKECSFGGECYAEKARARARESSLVIVNHALLLTDLMIKDKTDGIASMLGDYDAAILDESHELEDWATSSFSTRLTQYRFRQLTTECRNFSSNLRSPDVNEHASTVNVSAEALWASFAWREDEYPHRVVRDDLEERVDTLLELANGLESLAIAIEATPAWDKVKTQRDRLAKRVLKTLEEVMHFCGDPFTETVRWIDQETTRKGDVRIVINTAPVHVGKLLGRLLWSRTPSVLVSATLSAGQNDFSYLAERLGLDHFNYSTLDVGSPFDFTTQARLYVPEHLPAPDPKHRREWEAASKEEVESLVNLSDGRALILCTSMAQVRALSAHLRATTPYQVLVQKERPNSVLAEEFMADVHSVLVATKSFFTGVDFRGEACSLVVIDKLPFDVPNDPLIEARSEAIVAAGGSGFSDFTIPRMKLILRQGFGRLIRHTTDRGVVAILDSRLVDKGYGKGIRRSLPNAPLVTKIGEVEEFFEMAS